MAESSGTQGLIDFFLHCIKRMAEDRAASSRSPARRGHRPGAGDASRATNLYRAALAGPLLPVTRKDVEAMLTECLANLAG